MSDAAEFVGVVGAGDGRGRTLGFPTANVQVAAVDDLPRGVFAARARWDVGGERAAVVNIGSRPTFAGGEGGGPAAAVTVEVHVLDFDGDLYGKTVAVRLQRKLRDEQRFGSTVELTRQIAEDIERARAACGVQRAQPDHRTR